MTLLFACVGGPGRTTLCQSNQRINWLPRPNGRTEFCGVPARLANPDEVKNGPRPDGNPSEGLTLTHGGAQMADATNTRIPPIPKASWPRRGEKVVYFVATETGPIKIGRSFDFPQRMQHLRREHPDLELLAKFSGGSLEEGFLHIEMKHARLHGEWFDRHPDILALIAQLTPECGA